MDANGEQPYGKAFLELTNSYNFRWDMYDKCVEICDTRGFEQVSNFRPISPPEIPDNVIDGLEWLTVNEMKPLLKAHGEKVSGRREELENRLLGVLDFEELEPLLEDKSHDKIERYQRDVLIDKYTHFAYMVKFRSRFLYRITQYHDGMDKFFLTLTFHADETEERILARELDGLGFDNVIVDGKVCKLLPLFCGSFGRLRYDINRTAKYDSTISKTQNDYISTQDKAKQVAMLKELQHTTAINPNEFVLRESEKEPSLIYRIATALWDIIKAVCVNFFAMETKYQLAMIVFTLFFGWLFYLNVA